MAQIKPGSHLAGPPTANEMTITNGDALAFSTPHGAPGLTKREHFAGLTMLGLLASIGQHDVSEFSELASDAVLAADALIAKLNSPEAS